MKKPAKPVRKANKKTHNRPTTFKIGHKETRGRKKGVPNKITMQVKEAIMLAANNRGRDGKGTDGLVGYLEWLARVEPKSFASLLGRLVPINITGDLQVGHVVMTREEVAAKLLERGLPTDRLFALPAPPAEMKTVEAVVEPPVKPPVEQTNGSAPIKPTLKGVAPPREDPPKETQH